MKQHEVRWSGSDTCKLRDYKVRVNQQVKREQPLLLLEYTSSTETGSRLVVETLKSDVEGRVFSLPGKRGQKFEVGDILMIISTCTHPFQFEGICVQCNANVTQFQNAIASPMIVSKSKGIKLSHEAAAEIQKAHEEKLLKERKLCLILDLDLTVLHAVRADHLYNFDPEKYKAKIYSLEGIEYYTYYVKFRPYVEQFLEEIKDLYEIHVYTMSTRQYATSVVGIMDKMIEDGKRAMFGNSRTGFRLLTRDENSSSVKDLRTIFPHGDDIAVILDDREDVWESSLNNLIQIHPYTFSYFNHAGDIHDPKLPPPVHRPQYSTPSQKPRLSLNTDRKKKNKEQESTSSTSTSTTNQDSYIQQQAQLQQQQHQDSNIQQQSQLQQQQQQQHDSQVNTNSVQQQNQETINNQPQLSNNNVNEEVNSPVTTITTSTESTENSGSQINNNNSNNNMDHNNNDPINTDPNTVDHNNVDPNNADFDQFSDNSNNSSNNNDNNNNNLMEDDVNSNNNNFNVIDNNIDSDMNLFKLEGDDPAEEVSSSLSFPKKRLFSEMSDDLDDHDRKIPRLDDDMDMTDLEKMVVEDNDDNNNVLNPSNNSTTTVDPSVLSSNSLLSSDSLLSFDSTDPMSTTTSGSELKLTDNTPTQPEQLQPIQPTQPGPSSSEADGDEPKTPPDDDDEPKTPPDDDEPRTPPEGEEVISSVSDSSEDEENNQNNGEGVDGGDGTGVDAGDGGDGGDGGDDAYDVVEKDDHLLSVLKILKEVHTDFFSEYDRTGVRPDVKRLLSRLRRRVFAGCTFMFSGLYPMNAVREKRSLVSRCERYGAKYEDDDVKKITHLISKRGGTQKLQDAEKHSRAAYLVNPTWLVESMSRWERLDEKKYYVPIEANLVRPDGREKIKQRMGGNLLTSVSSNGQEMILLPTIIGKEPVIKYTEADLEPDIPQSELVSEEEGGGGALIMSGGNRNSSTKKSRRGKQRRAGDGDDDDVGNVDTPSKFNTVMGKTKLKKTKKDVDDLSSGEEDDDNVVDDNGEEDVEVDKKKKDHISDLLNKKQKKEKVDDDIVDEEKDEIADMLEKDVLDEIDKILMDDNDEDEDKDEDENDDEEKSNNDDDDYGDDGDDDDDF
eukprot:TRINITY_DN2284_c1_g1_i1.p1 TRINITY_DN2284_c1_g1~~TRINITY_DN2284_c1_g1_i1.p1  ORF type:complete len:1115 (-),score=417.57 TRINITY_DN2284_c1_g1_i1:260-3604(-)